MEPLTSAERERFAEHLRSEAAEYARLAKQISLLPNGGALAKPFQVKAATYAFVARELSSVEEVNLG